jgi:WD40 repeat protein
LSSRYFAALRATLREDTNMAKSVEDRSPHPSLAQDHVPRILRAHRIEATGQLSPSYRLSLSIGLSLRNRDELDQLLRDLRNPASSRFRQFLTADEFARLYGPTEADYQSIVAFAKSQGFEVILTHPNRTLLTIFATASQIEHAFRLRLLTFPHPIEKRLFYAPDTEPTVDPRVLILRINGLDDFHVRRVSRLPVSSEKVRPAGGSAPGGGYISTDFRNAYAPGVTLVGTGQSVGIYNAPHGLRLNDPVLYQKIAGISPAVPVSVLDLDGTNAAPDGSSAEVTSDVELAIAMAPGLSQVIVYQSNDYTTALNRMATDNDCKQLSTSWNTPPENSSADQIYQQFHTQGQTLFCSAGDAGSYYPTQPFSCDDPLITVVSGTQLTTDAHGSWSSEVVWHDTFGSGGGGTMGNYPLPDWQKNIDMTVNQGSTQFRNSPDVSMVAVNIFFVLNGANSGWEGTSAAAPLWAGYMALINEAASRAGKPPVGDLNPSLYAAGKSSSADVYFHDITIGNNLTPWNKQPNNANEYFASLGYDCCTGWGTPTGTDLIQAVGRDGPLFDLIKSAAISVANDADGRLELFSLGYDQSSYHIWQTRPNGFWSPWGCLAGRSLRQIVVGQNADGRLEVFALGGNRAVYHIWQTEPNGGWGTWAALAGHDLQQLALGKNADGRLELFALGGDGAVYHIWQTAPSGDWGDWGTLAGHDLSSLAVSSNADGRLELFALGGDRAVYHIWQTRPNGDWGDWATLGGHDLQSISVASNAAGRLEVFALGGDHAVYHIWQTVPNGDWASWSTLAGHDLRSIAVANNADGRLEVFALGGDRAAYHIWQVVPNGDWGGWATFAGQKLQQLAIGKNADGRLELFGLGEDGYVYHIWQTAPNGTWGTWSFLR